MHNHNHSQENQDGQQSGHGRSNLHGHNHQHNHQHGTGEQNAFTYSQKINAAIALKKAQTHIKNILQMIEDDEYCIDIMQQILSVNGLLKSATEKILQNHLHTCFLEGMSQKNQTGEKEKLIQEVIDVVNLANKSK